MPNNCNERDSRYERARRRAEGVGEIQEIEEVDWSPTVFKTKCLGQKGQ